MLLSLYANAQISHSSSREAACWAVFGLFVCFLIIKVNRAKEFVHCFLSNYHKPRLSPTQTKVPGIWCKVPRTSYKKIHTYLFLQKITGLSVSSLKFVWGTNVHDLYMKNKSQLPNTTKGIILNIIIKRRKNAVAWTGSRRPHAERESWAKF